MKLEDIQELWAEDSKINQLNLGTEVLNCSQLHHKYHKILTSERLILRKMEYEYKDLLNLRYEFYTGKLDDETLEAKGWLEEFRAFSIKVLKSDVQRYLDGDKVIATYALKVAYQKEKVELVVSIMSSINFRANAIRTAVDWVKFTNGAS